MNLSDDDQLCQELISIFAQAFPNLDIKGGADEPFYEAAKNNCDNKGENNRESSSLAIIHFRSNYPRSLLHEMAHYCLAGNRRRALDDFGYWYTECGRTAEQQAQFEKVEARPQALEKIMCQIIGIPFTPSLDDFSGRPASAQFLENLKLAYQDILSTPPPTTNIALTALRNYYEKNIPVDLPNTANLMPNNASLQ